MCVHACVPILSLFHSYMHACLYDDDNFSWWFYPPHIRLTLDHDDLDDYNTVAAAAVAAAATTSQ